MAPAAAAVDEDTENVHKFTGTTQSIEDSHIMTITRNSYPCTLTDFMLYLFTNPNHKLVNTVPLTVVKAVDDAKSTTKQQQEAKIAFMVVCVVQLKTMNQIQGNPELHLSGNNTIKYEDIAKYMGTKQRISDVDLDLANQLVATEGATVVNGAVGRGKVKVVVCLSNISYRAVQSGISFLYRQCVLERTAEIKHGLVLHSKGPKRKSRQLEQDLRLTIRNGK